MLLHSCVTLLSVAAYVSGAPTLGLLAGHNASTDAPHKSGGHKHGHKHDHLNGTQGAVATEIKTCSDIGVDIMKQGGNAADAMIGAQLCVGIIAGYHSGIGGGGFMTVRSPNGSYETIDFREFAPGAATELMYVNTKIPNASVVGGLAVAVPGELRGFEELHNRHGKLAWSKIIAPAIRLARDGFEVTRELAKVMQEYPFLKTDPAWAKVYAPNGTLAVAGQKLHRPHLAETLETVAVHGVKVFYEGPIAKRTIAKIRENGGIMTLDDLKKYKAVIRKPHKIEYRNYTIHSAPAPSSGTIALSTMLILSGYDVSNSSNINRTTHLLDEAMKFAYGQRGTLGDPAFVPNVTSLESRYLEDSTAKKIRERITLNKTHGAAYYDPATYEVQREHGTSHLVTADKSGMVVSLTSTINYYFGSRLMTEDGIILNDEMDDFSTPDTSNGFGYTATAANYIRPYKRPLSSISPCIVEDKEGKFVFATGAAGGSRIITATVQALWHFLDQVMDVQSAINARRMHDQILPAVTTFEYDYDYATTAYMKKMGNNVTWVAPGLSVVQAISRGKDGVFHPASDPRKLDSGSTAY
jgi:gamma-glutamyltranspeptidase/glutathione hydrolase